MYELFSKIDKLDSRAPSKIDLKADYEMTGTTEAASRGEAARKWFSGDVKGLYTDKAKPPKTGDVMKDATGKCFILTPEGLWALVTSSQ